MALSKKEIDAIANAVVEKLQAAGITGGGFAKKYTNETDNLLSIVKDAGANGITTTAICNKMDIGGKLVDSLIQRAKLKGLIKPITRGLWTIGDGEKVTPTPRGTTSGNFVTRDASGFNPDADDDDDE